MQWAAVRIHWSLSRLAPHRSSCGLRLYSITCLQTRNTMWFVDSWISVLSLLRVGWIDLRVWLKSKLFLGMFTTKPRWWFSVTTVLRPPQHHSPQRSVYLCRTPTAHPHSYPFCSRFRKGDAGHNLQPTRNQSESWSETDSLLTR